MERNEPRNEGFSCGSRWHRHALWALLLLPLLACIVVGWEVISQRLMQQRRPQTNAEEIDAAAILEDIALADGQFASATPVKIVWTSDADSKDADGQGRVVLLAKQGDQHLLIAAYKDKKSWQLYERSEWVEYAGSGVRWDRWVRGFRECPQLPTDREIQELLHEVKWSP